MLCERRRQDCLTVIDELLHFEVSQCFTISADALVDHLADYSTVIPTPIDLLQIKQKLIQRKYSRYSEFRDDIELVWQNAITYNGADSIVGLSAKYLRSKFREQTRFMTDDEAADWVSRTNCLLAWSASVLEGIREAIENTPTAEPEPEAEPEQERRPSARGRRPASKSSGKAPRGRL
jgi:hypothetical protein